MQTYQEKMADLGYVNGDFACLENKGLDGERILHFVKNTQQYEWAMINAKLGDHAASEMVAAIAQSIAEKGVLSTLRFPIDIAGVEVRLAYFDSNVDPARPMMTNYYKNELEFYGKEDLGVIALNGIPFLAFTEAPETLPEGLQFIPFISSLKAEGELYQRAENGQNWLLAVADEVEKTMTKERLLTLLYRYVVAGIIPSFKEFEVIEQLARLTQISLNRRYRLLQPTADRFDVVLFWLSHALAREEENIVDTVIVIGDRHQQAEQWTRWAESLLEKPIRFSAVQTDRDLMVALARSMEVVFLDADLLETLFQVLPNWRTRKVAFVLDDASYNPEKREYVWKRLEQRPDKERAVCFWPAVGGEAFSAWED